MMEIVHYSQMFYVIFQFCARVKFATLDGKIAMDRCTGSNTIGGKGVIVFVIAVM